jgi:hypothetical protein
VAAQHFPGCGGNHDLAAAHDNDMISAPRALADLLLSVAISSPMAAAAAPCRSSGKRRPGTPRRGFGKQCWAGANDPTRQTGTACAVRRCRDRLRSWKLAMGTRRRLRRPRRPHVAGQPPRRLPDSTGPALPQPSAAARASRRSHRGHRDIEDSLVAPAR